MWAKPIATRHALVWLAVAVTVIGSMGEARGQTTLRESLEGLIENHSRLKAAEADVRAAGERVSVAWGDWYPTLGLSSSYGRERQLKGDTTADTDLSPRDAEAKVTQLLWDFGSTNAAIDAARLSFTQAQATRDDIRQTVLLEGISAYLDLIRRKRLLDFAKGSEDNIKRQTELEDARVQRGSGFSTDVLQAKQQLAGASAARVRAEGAVQQAINRYTSVFYAPPDLSKPLKPPVVPAGELPKTVEEVLETALKENPSLRAARLGSEVARASLTQTKADEFAPTINLVGRIARKHDIGGTVGYKQENEIRAEIKYDFNIGMTAVNTLRVSQYSLEAVENRSIDTRQTVTEQARNAWQELITARLNAELLGNQANIASEFLENARKERQLGRRTLIDVLSGETAFINASSDAASAETDVAVAVFKILAIMGRLSLDHAG